MRKRGNPTPWIGKAEQDYVAAVLLARKRHRQVPDIICFHAQQCAEKYLKAFLVWQGVYFPKTHDLTTLLDLATPYDAPLELLRPRLDMLTRYAVEFRYPDEHSTVAEARRAMTSATHIRERLRHLLRCQP